MQISFQHCINLRSVYLDNNINEIVICIFQCASLVSAVIDIDALNVIPQYCFQECVICNLLLLQEI